MKLFVTLIIGCFLTFQGVAQLDAPIRSGKIESNDNPLDIKPSNKGTALNFPSVLDKKPDYNLKDSLTARNIKMLPDRDLKQAGFDMVIDPKIREKEDPDSKTHFGDMYMGDVTTTAKFVGIVCRDHEYVDGDRVKIYADGDVVEPDIHLTGVFKGINLDLKKGFNRIDFEALNQGFSGPNTAQVNVYDEKGELIYSSKWNLSTGSKATLVIVKE